MVILNAAKNLIISAYWKIEILRLTPQDDMATQLPSPARRFQYLLADVIIHAFSGTCRESFLRFRGNIIPVSSFTRAAAPTRKNIHEATARVAPT